MEFGWRGSIGDPLSRTSAGRIRQGHSRQRRHASLRKTDKTLRCARGMPGNRACRGQRPLYGSGLMRTPKVTTTEALGVSVPTATFTEPVAPAAGALTVPWVDAAAIVPW
jgi:hypothetical protein